MNSGDSQALSIGGRQIRVQAWKSIKKAKEGKQTPRRAPNSNKPENTSTSTLPVRIPTNIRGEAAKKQYIQRALKKRFDRKQQAVKSGVVEGGVKKVRNKVKKTRHRDQPKTN